MEKEFVPYELAVKLKELGFDEPCLAFYNGKFIQSTEFDFDSYNSKDIGDCPLAPTFSQAFRWFREKHGLCIVIKPIDDKKIELGYNLTKNGLIMGGYTTYEKAELACLTKLIEIVETKSE